MKKSMKLLTVAILTVIMGATALLANFNFLAKAAVYQGDFATPAGYSESSFQALLDNPSTPVSVPSVTVLTHGYGAGA